MIIAATGAPKGYLNIESGGIDFIGPLKWILIVAALGGLAHLTWWVLTTKAKERAVRQEQSTKQEQQEGSGADPGARARR